MRLPSHKEVFLIAVFFRVHFYRRTPGTYLHHTVSVVGLPDHVLLIFPITCTDTLVPVLPVEVCWQKFTWRKIRRSKNSTVIDRASNFPSIPVEFFSIAVFFRGGLSKILTFWGLVGVRFLFLCEFFYGNIEMFTSKKNFGTPPARSETGFGFLSEFRSRTHL